MFVELMEIVWMERLFILEKISKLLYSDFYERKAVREVWESS